MENNLWSRLHPIPAPDLSLRRRLSSNAWLSVVRTLLNGQICSGNMMLRGISGILFALRHSVLLLKALVAVFCCIVALRRDCILDVLSDPVDSRTMSLVCLLSTFVFHKY